MKTTNLPLRILINTKCEENSLIIEVYNSGKWIEPMLEDNGTGTGLNNVKQRLINAYPNKHSFEILKNNDSVCVKIKLDELKTNE